MLGSAYSLPFARLVKYRGATSPSVPAELHMRAQPSAEIDLVAHR